MNDFELLSIKNFFDANTCGELITEMRRLPSTAALTYAADEIGSVDNRTRKVARVEPSPHTVGFVMDRLIQHRQEIGDYFGVELNDCENPQFLRYRVGDFFVAHQDGNTGMVRLQSDQLRRVSASIFLNDQSEQPEPDKYCGGSLVFHDCRNARSRSIAGESGTLLAFRSETTHEVVPVTFGERYSIVAWYRI